MPAKKKPKATTNTAAKAAKAKPAAPAKKMSALDAAAKVLGETGGAMSAKELIETMAAKGYWSSPNGKTPAATLYAAILREVTTKGSASRFQKTGPGAFAATGASVAVPATPVAAKTSPKVKGAKAKPAPKKKAAKPAPAEAAIPDGTPGPTSVSELFRI